MDQGISNEHSAREAVELHRRACLWLTAISIVIAVMMVVASAVSIEPRGTPPLAFLAAAVLVVARIFRGRAWLSRIGDGLGALGISWIGGLAAAVVAVVGLHLHFPLADGRLRAADHAFGFDGLALVNWLSVQPSWVIDALSAAYFETIPFLYLSMVVLALIGDRLEVWRAAFCFIGTVLSACLISIIVPAKGLGVWASPELIARLPARSIRHFWPSFDKFYGVPHPVLQVDSIGGVVCFPSFHTAMGLIGVAMWRKRPIVFYPALLCCGLMIVSTLPFGGHYAVDVIGGAALWCAWFTLSRRLEAAAYGGPSAQQSSKLTLAGVA